MVHAARIFVLFGLVGCGRGPFSNPAVDACADADGSVGCSFVLARVLHRPRNGDDADALLVSNPGTETTRVALSRVVEGGDLLEEGQPRLLDPGDTLRFDLLEGYAPQTTSMRDREGAYRLLAEDPVAAQLFSPGDNRTANDASLLLPTPALGASYVVASYAPFSDPAHFDSPGVPSFFTVVATQDDTRVAWIPRVPTAGTEGVPAAEAGQRTEVVLDRFERLRVAAAAEPPSADADISGTLVETSRPALVVGAVACAYVPAGTTLCDHLQEALIPVSRWGTEYVLAPSPPRAAEPTVWRVYAGADDVLVQANPGFLGYTEIFPLSLSSRGDYVEFMIPSDTRTVLKGSGAFMPVQYMVGKDLAVEQGDPAMTQYLPVAAWRNRYAFGTGSGFEHHVVQLVRGRRDRNVTIDGVEVFGWKRVHDYQVVDWVIEPGAHVAESETPFALTHYGWSDGLGELNRWAAYALPGGFARADSRE